MSTLSQIKQPIQADFLRFEATYKENFLSDNQLLNSVGSHLLLSQGKKMRPLLVLLCAQLCGKISQATLHGANALELLHMASLIHDDVVDESDTRRGENAVHTEFNNSTAILSGDYYLANALNESVLSQQFEIVANIAQLGKTLADGELLQLFSVDKLGETEAHYFQIIEKKTASLFACSAKIGALSVGASKSVVETMEAFGKLVGTCFQIQDDIFDFSQEQIGKPTGNDIKEGKITLPLIYVYNKAEQTLQTRIAHALQKKDVNFLHTLAHKEGGIAYAQEKMEKLKQEAIALLESFAPSPTKEAIVRYVDYVLNRKK